MGKSGSASSDKIKVGKGAEGGKGGCC